jgi:hypothetical protein
VLGLPVPCLGGTRSPRRHDARAATSLRLAIGQELERSWKLPVPDPAERASAELRRRQAEASVLAQELSLLRKYAGFTPARLAKAALLTHMLGGADQPFESLRERFVSAIESLRNPEPDLLLAVFGLAPDTEQLRLLSERRESYGQTIGRGTETVADLEPPALEHLQAQLVSGWYPLSPLAIRVPASHNGAIFESIDVRLVVKDKKWHETRENYRFLAAFDEADYLGISMSYSGLPEPICDDFTVRTVRKGDSFSHQFWHKEPMRRGSFYDLRFRLAPEAEDDDPENVIETCRAFHEPTRSASFEAVFLGDSPRLIWQYERLSYFERPGEPTAQQLLRLDGNSVRVRFTNVYGGLFHGIAWRW